MNPSGKNEVFDENLLNNLDKYQDDFFKRFTIIATSTKWFSIAEKWDAMSKRLNVPYYNLVCCGLYGFVFISLGSNYEYREINK
jgi:ubiquitin-like 1-activating enzyme E1 A